MKFRLLNNTFTYWELENDEKNIYVDRFDFLPLHIYRRHQSPPENVPNSQSSVYMQKYYHLFKQNVLSDHNRKNTHN